MRGKCKLRDFLLIQAKYSINTVTLSQLMLLFLYKEEVLASEVGSAL